MFVFSRICFIHLVFIAGHEFSGDYENDGLVNVQELGQPYDGTSFRFPKTLEYQIGEDVTGHRLVLTRNDHVTDDSKVYVLTRNEDGSSNVEKQDSAGIQDYALYQDLQNGGVFTVRYRCERLKCRRTIMGSFYKGPFKFHLEAATRDLSAENDDLYHLIKIKESRSEHQNLNDFAMNFGSEQFLRRKRSLMKVNYYIELLMVLDYSVYQNWFDKQNGTLEEKDKLAVKKMREYFSHYVNGIDLRFRSIDDAEMAFFIKLAGYIICKTNESSPWTMNNRGPVIAGKYGRQDRHSVSLSILKDFRAWHRNATEEKKLPEHDHAMLWTIDDLADGDFTGVAGYAYVSGVCTSSMVSVVEEHGAFSSIGIAAHELGHNLGAGHDVGDVCPSKHQFIMSPSSGAVPTDAENPWKFSNCSVEDFRILMNNLNNKDKNCLLDKSTHTDPDFESHISLLPGQLYGVDEQCALLYQEGSKQCKFSSIPEEEICQKLWCTSTKSNFCYSGSAAAMGTSCGKEKWCIRGACVNISETIQTEIPTVEPVTTFKPETTQLFSPTPTTTSPITTSVPVSVSVMKPEFTTVPTTNTVVHTSTLSQVMTTTVLPTTASQSSSQTVSVINPTSTAVFQSSLTFESTSAFTSKATSLFESSSSMSETVSTTSPTSTSVSEISSSINPTSTVISKPSSTIQPTSTLVFEPSSTVMVKTTSSVESTSTTAFKTTSVFSAESTSVISPGSTTFSGQTSLTHKPVTATPFETNLLTSFEPFSTPSSTAFNHPATTSFNIETSTFEFATSSYPTTAATNTFYPKTTVFFPEVSRTSFKSLSIITTPYEQEYSTHFEHVTTTWFPTSSTWSEQASKVPEVATTSTTQATTSSPVKPTQVCTDSTFCSTLDKKFLSLICRHSLGAAMCCQACKKLNSSEVQCTDKSWYCRYLRKSHCYKKSYVTNCCETCKKHGVEDSGEKSCTDSQQCRYTSRYRCYSSYIQKKCCEMCEKNKVDIPGCEYGDKKSYCRRITAHSKYRCYKEENQCCESCDNYVDDYAHPKCKYGNSWRSNKCERMFSKHNKDTHKFCSISYYRTKCCKICGYYLK